LHPWTETGFASGASMEGEGTGGAGVKELIGGRIGGKSGGLFKKGVASGKGDSTTNLGDGRRKKITRP